MSNKIYFCDHDGRELACAEGGINIGPIHRPSGEPTMAIKVAGKIVARAEDIDGLRWVVETARITVVNQDGVDRATLGDNGRSFAASTAQIADE